MDEQLHTTVVNICGISLAIQTNQEIEYVERLAREIDMRLQRLCNRSPHLPLQRIAILLCLQLADEREQGIGPIRCQLRRLCEYIDANVPRNE